MILIIAVVGLGSFLFHTVGTRWAEWGDVLPILVFVLLYVWLVPTLFFGWPAWLKGGGVALLLFATVFLEVRAPASFLWGGALYLPMILTLAAFSITLWRMEAAAGRAMALAGGVFLLSLTARTVDMPLCDAWPLGTHFMWHVLNAVLLYVLMRVAIVHAPKGAEQRV